MSATADTVPAPHNVPFLNILDPKFDSHTSEVALAQAQAENWYAQTPIGPLVLRYAETQALLRDRRMTLDNERFLATKDIFGGPIYDWFVSMIINRDGDDHRRLRDLVNKAFSPAVINNLRPFIRTTVERLAEDLGSGGVCEFVEAFADPLPLAVICRLLGVPFADYDAMRTWLSAIGPIITQFQGGAVTARAETGLVALYGYVDSLMAEKRAKPADDLVSAWMVGREAEDSVSKEELRNLIVALMLLGKGTTRQQLTNAMVPFCEHPEQWTLLSRRPELVTQAVKEVMRWFPATHSLRRFAAEDFEYQGLSVTEGAIVMMSLRTAQRDPRVVHDGDSFDITVTRKMPLLQFGVGAHYCVAAALASLEVGEMLSVLSRRLGPPSIAGPVTWRPPLGISGPITLPLRFG